MNLPQIDIVLVRTIYSSNIGAASRALANMGGQKLILVDPQTEVNSKARQGAAGAQEKLQSRTVYDSWKPFYDKEPDGIRIAFTKRSGRLRDSRPLPQLLENIYNNSTDQLGRPLYLIFGPEDNGLSADDLALTNFSASIPTFGAFSSINLSHAVIVSLYIVQNFFQAGRMNKRAETLSSPSKSKVQFPEDTLKRWLVTLGFDLEDRRTSAYLILRKILLQNTPSESELMVLESILQQNIRKLKAARPT